ncbi:hypothetical protein THAOC_04074 [Thalassiosira oceanica]|uniref:Uncharacterized protein n=1 Tax=Thalassiosira oceanica TaxID=159749 RepID=K0TP88_THAOC|nr:hypothetical protein THAOC_04074 [Thalassiosira oceanica]|eukprot:EJK74262.1 hypothetical protein THAOC_04074 [Thalassiosira oceanica]
MAPRATFPDDEAISSSPLKESAKKQQAAVAGLVVEDDVDQRNDVDVSVGKIDGDEDRRKSPSPTNDRRLSNPIQR